MGESIKNKEVKVSNNEEMNDKDILNDVLISYKHLVSSYGIALNEASNKNIYKLYLDAFLSSSKTQASLFETSFKNGWYVLETADEEKIENAYTKFSKCLNEIDIKNSK